MTRFVCDIAIVGSGFGGTLLAIIARRLGYAVALLERGVHPRFAIGESSTPLADFRLAAIARQFGLDWLAPFTKYGTWKATYPEVRCGLKRGFSFFRHSPGQPFTPTPDNDNLLLVEASPSDERADTHWLRADFDAYLVGKAREAGVQYLDGIEIHKVRHDRGWHLSGTRPAEEIEIDADFVIDATGDGQVLGRVLGLESVGDDALQTRSRAVYSHFTGVARWQDILGPHAVGHPFPCDAAALHQIIDNGWMWVLRFDDGVTSAGFSLNPEAHPLRTGETAEAEWRRLLGAYPSLAAQFAHAEAIRPFVRTGRLQRRVTQAAGVDWAMLPHAAGFLDAWLSPGIAQTLFAVERLGRIFAEDWRGAGRAGRLARYSDMVLSELAWMDQITGTCFACFDRFEVMISVAMLYFIAAIYCEERERAGKAPPDAAFLLADHAEYRQIGADFCARARRASAADAPALAADMHRALAEFNSCNLCDPRQRNLYSYAGTVSK